MIPSRTVERWLPVIVAVVSPIACHSPAEQYLEGGRRALGREQYREAITLFAEVVLLAPASPKAAEALYEMALIHYMKLRDVNAARSTLRNLLNKYPGSEVANDARLTLARLYEEDLRAPAKAIQEYEELLSDLDDPGEERAILLSIAECHYRLDQLQRAAEDYRRVIEGYPYDAQSDLGFLRLAHIETLAGRPEAVLEVLVSLLELTDQPESRRRAFLARTEVLLASNRYGEAKACLKRAEYEFPGLPELFELADRLRQKEREGKSLDDGGRESQQALAELQSKIRWGWGSTSRRGVR